MIVYNVQRQFFVKKDDAERARVAAGLKPAATLALRVETREDLAALLNALCDPPVAGSVALPATTELVDRAYVARSTDIPTCVPKFLIEAWAKLEK